MTVFNPKSPIWQLAFRPFFLFGSIFAILSITTWFFVIQTTELHARAFDPIIWHAHEMIYGFSAAIIAGFVLTAAQNWSGIRGLHHFKLQFLFLLWVTGRILIGFSKEPNAIATITDLLFFPCVGFFLAPYLKDSELKPERIFFVFFVLFFTGNLLTHLDSFHVIQNMALKGILLGLNTVILVIIFMGGRVIPFFTESSVAKAQPKVWSWVETMSHISGWLFLMTSFLNTSEKLLAIVSFSASIIHFIRLAGWQVPRVRRIPLIWILHTAYLWLVLGFLMSGLSALGYIPLTLSIHAFTVGGIGVIIYGMIARVALGHTGRTLRPHFWIVVGFYLLNLTALIRVFAPLIAPAYHLWIIGLSAGLWGVAFLIYTCVYTPFLISPRIDGRQG